MKKLIFKFIFTFFISSISTVFSDSIQTNNKILTYVGKKSITVLDLKKEMDRQLFLNDKSIFDNPQAVFSYYNGSWKAILKKLVQDELLLLESEKLGFSIPPFEISKKTTELFGENPVALYEFISITPEDAAEAGKRELMSLYLSYNQIWNKSLMEVTPKHVEKAYLIYINDLAKKNKWVYQTLYIQSKDEELIKKTSSEISKLLKDESFSNLASIIGNLEESSMIKIAISKDITLSTSELSPSLLSILENLEEGMMSDVITSKASESYTGKVLHLKEVKKEPIPEFSTLSDQLKNSLVNSYGEQMADKYFSTLYKKYDVVGLYGKALIQSPLTPFTFENE